MRLRVRESLSHSIGPSAQTQGLHRLAHSTQAQNRPPRRSKASEMLGCPHDPRRHDRPQACDPTGRADADGRKQRGGGEPGARPCRCQGRREGSPSRARGPVPTDNHDTIPMSPESPRKGPNELNIPSRGTKTSREGVWRNGVTGYRVGHFTGTACLLGKFT